MRAVKVDGYKIEPGAYLRGWRRVCASTLVSVSEDRLRCLVAVVLGAGMVAMGAWRLVDPAEFHHKVPGGLGTAHLHVLLAGILEISVGIGLLTRRFRSGSAKVLVGLLVALYVGNLNQWINGTEDISILYVNLFEVGGTALSTSGHVIRALTQAVLIVLALGISGTDEGWLISHIRPFLKHPKAADQGSRPSGAVIKQGFPTGRPRRNSGGAHADGATTWPEGVDPVAAGVIIE